MKHENSNASTATTSSAGTPPTPEINGNIPNNNNYNYQHQLQQVPQMPSQPELNVQQHMHHVPIPQQTSNSWEQQMTTHPQQHVAYSTTNEMVNNVPPLPHQPVEIVSNGEYVNYAVNEQYSNKFEQVQTTPSGATSAPTNYDSWVRFLFFLKKRLRLIFIFSRTSSSQHQPQQHGITINNTTNKCNRYTRISHRHNHSLMSGTTIPISIISSSNNNKRRTQCTTTRTITTKLTSIALIVNHQHQLTIIQTQIHRCTTTASTIITRKIQRLSPTLLLLLNSSSSK